MTDRAVDADVETLHETLQTFNYAIVAVAAVLIGTGVWWIVSARNWFRGPRVQGSPEELAAIEAQLRDGAEVSPAGAAGG